MDVSGHTLDSFPMVALPEPVVPTVVRYRGLSVRLFCDSPVVSKTLRSQFQAYGAQIAEEDPDPVSRAHQGTVFIRRASATEPVTGWQHINIHGGGDALVPTGAALLTGPPVSITTVTKPYISVLQCEDLPHLPFLHHMVKYPIRAAIEERGGILAHSAAVEVAPGRCALFLGASGAGKTTVFLELVTRGLGGLGNDSTLLEPGPDGIEAAAWPHIVRIAPGTARHNAVLGRMGVDDWAPRSRKDGKYELFFDTLGDLLGRPVAGSPGQVSVVVDLAIDVAGTEFAIRRLAPSEARAILDRQLVADRLPTGWLPGWSWEPDPARVSTVAEHFINRVPICQARIGVADPRWADRLLDWLTLGFSS